MAFQVTIIETITVDTDDAAKAFIRQVKHILATTQVEYPAMVAIVNKQETPTALQEFSEDK